MPSFHFYHETEPAKLKGEPLKIGKDVLTGQSSFETSFGTINSLEQDLLVIASCIFAVDRGQKRGEREEFARRLELHIPVVNIGMLQSQIPAIEKILRILSNDLWSINFAQHAGGVHTPAPASKANPGQVLLFSGGLDSLAAAVEFSQVKPALALVSHVTKNRQTIDAQNKLFQLLKAKGCNLEHYSYFVSSRDKGEFAHDVENSQRTRSFLFLTLAAITANRLNRREIVLIAENGQMAVHLPLSSARMAAFSTHTAHPDVLVEMTKFLSNAFATSFKITNPYISKTKKEVIAPIVQNAPDAIGLSNSCWKSARIPKGATHCGECIPCFIRRIAIESYMKDPTLYGRDIFSLNFGGLPSDDEGRRNLSDLAEFTLNFETLSDQELFTEWPELYSENIDASNVIAMYRRAAVETRAILSKYPAGIEVLS